MMKFFTLAGLKPTYVRRTYLKVRPQFHHILIVIFFRIYFDRDSAIMQGITR